MVHLATGLAVYDGRALLVASRYANHAQPLWNLPGGRQQPGELLEETVVREVFEETGLHVEAAELAYVSESYDGAMHFLNATFKVTLPFDSLTLAQDRLSAQGDTGRSFALAQGDAGAGSDHVVAVDWVAIDELAERIVVGVVREPLIAYLRGALPRRYAGYHDAGVTIEWPADSR